MTQVTIARSLEISQSALSKIESGFLIPSAPQWFEFCRLTEISPESLTKGYIERMNPKIPMELEAAGSEMGFKLPKAYRDERGSKMRAMIPFVMYFRSVVGDQKVDDYFSSVKMDGDILIDRDSQINLAFCLDLCRTMIYSGHFKPTDFAKLTASSTDGFIHGSLHEQYAGKKDRMALLEALIGNSRRYECNFRYELRDKKADRITLSVAPEPHLAKLSYRTDTVLGDFLCRYKKHYFQHFVSYNGGKDAQLEEKQCHYHGADSCVYQLTF